MYASDNSSAKPPPLPKWAGRRRSPWRALLIILSLLLFVVVVGLLGLIVRHSRLSGRINAKLAAIRALHEPVSLAELNLFYRKVPEQSNAAALYTDALKIIRQSKALRNLEHDNELPS